MSEKKLGKRLLTWVLVLAMALSMLPVSALAADYTLSFTKTDGSDPSTYKVFYSVNGGELKEFGSSLYETPSGDRVSILFFVAPAKGYAISKISHSGNTGSNFFSIVNTANVTDCEYYEHAETSNGVIGNECLTADQVSSLIQEAKSSPYNCVAAFQYSIASNSQLRSISRSLSFYTEHLATLKKEIVGYYRGDEEIQLPDVGAGDEIRYKLTVDYYDVDAIKYSNVRVTDALVGYDSETNNDFTGSGSSESVEVTYTVEETDLNVPIVNTAELSYDYKARFNAAEGTDTGVASITVTVKNAVSYKYTGDVPAGVTPPAAKDYTPGASVEVAYPDSVPGYTFNGWELSSSVTDLITDEDGKIESFTMPNRSVTLTGRWTANDDTRYTVNHHQQNLDDDAYTLVETESDLTGTTGSKTEATAKNYDGFTAKAFRQETIAADGSTVIDIYYDRNFYTVTYEYAGTTPSDATALPAEARYKHGTSVTVAESAEATGYTFSGWNRTGTFPMPADDVTITGSWTPIQYGYTINYFYDGVQDTDKTDLGTAPYNSKLTYKDKSGSDYLLSEVKPSASITITDSATKNVINVYYTKKTADYTVNYYWNGDKSTPIAASETVTGDALGADVTVNAKTINGYTPIEASKTLTLNESSNVIDLYYYKNVELTASSDSCTYDGETHTVSGFTGAPEGVTFAGVSAEGSGINAGEYPVAFSDSAAGKVDASGNYIIAKLTPGKLSIAPYAEEILIAVAGKNESKIYNGKEQSASGYDVTITGGNGLYTAANVTYRYGTPSASGTNASDSPYKMNLKGTDFDYKSPNFSNLKISVTDGSLTISKRSVTLTSATASKAYDGTPLTRPDVTVSGDGFVAGEVSDIRATGSVTEVGSVTNTIAYTEGAAFLAGNYDIVKNEGTLTVSTAAPKEFTLTVEYVYAGGGTAAQSHTASVVEGAAYSVTSPVLSGYTADKTVVSGVMPAENVSVTVTYTRNRRPSSGGSSTSRPSAPTVEIEDDDALGLNTTDHFAYIVGYGNGEVRPQNNITRAEVATIFFRLLTDDVRDANLSKTNRYSDVADTAWYNTAVSTLSAMGIISGYPDGTFRPNAAITRAEFAAIAARFDPNGDTTAAAFADIASHWAKDEISIAANNGWIKGYEDNTFRPQRDITRAETMTLVNRVLNRQPETEDDLLPNMTVWTDNADKKAWYYLAVQEATNSHYYEFKTDSVYEKWTELRETRDWTQLEK